MAKKKIKKKRFKKKDLKKKVTSPILKPTNDQKPEIYFGLKGTSIRKPK